MLKNYLKIAFRNIFKHKAYSFINIAGLAFGMSCCLLIVIYIQHELSFDRFHGKSDRIYRLIVDIFPPTGQVDNYATCGPAVAPIISADFPEIEQAVRVRPIEDFLVNHGTDRFYEDFTFVDSTFFDIFDFEFVADNRETALAAPFSIILTEEMASKYFGDHDVIDRTLIAEDTLSFRVTGIIENSPGNSHLDFDFLVSQSTLRPLGMERNFWWYFKSYTYLLLAENSDVAALGSKLHRISAEHIPDQEEGSGYRQEHYLQSLSDIHLHSDRRHELKPNSKLKYVYIFASIGVFLLLIACVNFMNLATARSLERAKEIGVRKVVGAVRTQLARQFLAEAVVLSLLAGVIAVPIVELLKPYFNQLLGLQTTLSFLANPLYLAGIFIFALCVGALAGSYPAFLLSSFRPVETIKGDLKTSSKGTFLRQGLVVFQFSVSIVMIIATAIVYQQLNFMRDQDLGYEQEQVLVLAGRGDSKLNEKYKILKQELRGIPGIQASTVMSSLPGREFNNRVIKTEGQNVQSQYGTDNWNDMRYLNTDHDFFAIFGVQVIVGRHFSDEFESDAQRGFMLNEAAVKRLGWDSPASALGKNIGFRNSNEGQVIGIVKDFYFKSLHSAVDPLVLTMRPDRMEYISIKLATRNVRESLSTIENAWQRAAPGRPFDFFFLNDEFDKQYRADEQLGRTFGGLSSVAIAIACLGLFGLAAYSAQQRTREIGIRKVLGASATNIVRILSSDFLKLVLLATLVACPLAFYVMRAWLRDFAFRTDIQPVTFLLAGSVAMVIAFLTIVFQAVRAAYANPVESLRFE